MSSVSKTKRDNKKPASSVPPELWKRHRDAIYDSYIVRNETLKEVMSHMRDRYQFRATKMYKNQAEQWGMVKNLSPEVTARIKQLASNPNPSAAFGDTVFFQDERQIPPETVKRACRRRKRKPGSRKQYDSKALLSSECRQKLPRTLIVLEHAGRALQGIRDYVAFAVKKDIWVQDPVSQLYVSTQAGQSGRFRLSQWHDSLWFSLNIHGHSRNVQCHERLLCAHLESLDSIFKDQDPFLVPDILSVLAQLHSRQGVRPLASRFIIYVRAAAARVLGFDHQVACSWRAIEACTHSARADFIYCSLRVLADEFEQFLCPGGDTAAVMTIMRLHLGRATSVLCPKQGEVDRCLPELVSMAEASPASDEVGLGLLICAARNLVCLDRIQEASEIVTDILQLVHRCPELTKNAPEVEYDVFLLVGALDCRQHHNEKASGNIQQALWNAAVYGMNPGLPPHCARGLWLEGLAHMEIFCRSIGDTAKADEAQRYLEQACKG